MEGSFSATAAAFVASHVYIEHTPVSCPLIHCSIRIKVLFQPYGYCFKLVTVSNELAATL